MSRESARLASATKSASSHNSWSKDSPSPRVAVAVSPSSVQRVSWADTSTVNPSPNESCAVCTPGRPAATATRTSTDSPGARVAGIGPTTNAPAESPTTDAPREIVSAPLFVNVIVWVAFDAGWTRPKSTRPALANSPAFPSSRPCAASDAPAGRVASGEDDDCADASDPEVDSGSRP